MGEREDEMNIGGRLDEGGEFSDTAATLRATDTDDVLDDEEVDEAARLRSDIEQTRAGMSETIDAIQERLSPENIKEQVMEQVGEAVQSAKDSVREATIGRVEKVMENVGESMGRAGTAVTETGSSIIDTIRQNPLPAALIGLGVGMLVMNRSRGRSDFYRADFDEYDEYDYGYPAEREVSGSQGRSVVGRVQSAVGDAVSNVQETAGSAATQMREQIGRLGDQVQRGARRAGDQFQTQLQENPLAVGAVALALGAAVGLALPSTRVENQYMGEARDNLVDKAQQAARDTMQKVQQVAQEAGRTLQGEDQGQAG